MNISRALIKPDCNGIYKLHLYADELPKLVCKEVASHNGYHFFYAEQDGFVSFYVTNDNDPWNGPEYHWSSRTGVFNTLFNKQLLDVIIHLNEQAWGYGCYYITADKAREFLPENFTIIKEFDGKEFTYNLAEIIVA